MSTNRSGLQRTVRMLMNFDKGRILFVGKLKYIIKMYQMYKSRRSGSSVFKR